MNGEALFRAIVVGLLVYIVMTVTSILCEVVQ